MMLFLAQYIYKMPNALFIIYQLLMFYELHTRNVNGNDCESIIIEESNM